MSQADIVKSRSRHHRSTKMSAEDQKKSLHEIYNWPWEIDIELFADKTSKVAFMSGQDREYYPEKPGHSRHGVEYSMHVHPGDVPNPSYVPSENRLQKPVSTKGYGIGGLLAPRWKEEKKVVPRNSFKFVEEEELTEEVRKSIESAEREQKNAIPPEVLAEEKRHKREMRLMAYHAIRAPTKDQCRQRKLAFGGSTRIPRFKIDKERTNTPGVAHYDVRDITQCKKVPIYTTFGTGPLHLNEAVVTNCDYLKYDCCVECLKPQVSTDYYRTIQPIVIPQDYFTNYSTHAEATRPTRFSASETTSKSRSSLAASISKMSKLPLEGVLKNAAPKFITLCRSCYCDIQDLGHTYWTPKRMEEVKFKKTRHCVNIHEHNNLPSFVYKVPCKLLRKLKRKEALMNKHFQDHCEPVTEWA